MKVPYSFLLLMDLNCFLGLFNPGCTKETQAGIRSKRMGKSSVVLPWPVTSVMNNGRQAEAGARKEGSANLCTTKDVSTSSFLRAARMGEHNSNYFPV